MAIKIAPKVISCPIQLTLTIIGDKWKVLILRDLFTAPKRRFNELMRSLNPISQKMLTQQLRSLEDHGLVNRKVYPQVPPKVEYSLTELGHTLGPVLWALKEWGIEHEDYYKDRYHIELPDMGVKKEQIEAACTKEDCCLSVG